MVVFTQKGILQTIAIGQLEQHYNNVPCTREIIFLNFNQFYRTKRVAMGIITPACSALQCLVLARMTAILGKGVELCAMKRKWNK